MYDPERYETHKSASAADSEEFVPALIKAMTWKNNETILDYGCGAGSVANTHFVPVAIKYDSKIYAVDISKDMIRYAQEKFPHPRVHYVEGNIQAEGFPLLNTKFDRIFSIYVLHFIRDYRKVLRTFHDMLKPGGQLGFTLPTKTTTFLVLQILGEDPKWSPYMKGYEQFVPEWYEKNEDAEECFRKALDDIGYKLIHIKTHSREHTYTFNTVIDFYISINPFLPKIPKELMADLRADYRRHISNFDGVNVSPDVEFVPMKYEMCTCLAEKCV